MALLWCVGASPVLAAASGPMGIEDARHLLSRTGFAPHPREIATFAALDRAAAIERLLAPARGATVTPPPAWVDEAFVGPRAVRAMTDDARREHFRNEQRRAFELRAWWFEQMVATDTPLAERMTLFWHNHFATGMQKVRYATLMYRQHRTLREHALGSFAALLPAVARDPAMVIYLDSATSRAGRPNENFARELMELFTLGEGRYDESDVREAARAFTGWSIDPDDGTFRFRPALHDAGEKTVLGRTGRLQGDDVLGVLLAHPATAEHLTERLWREFVSPDPDPAEVKRIAARFRASGHQVRVALDALFRTPAFWAPEQRGALVKSPVDLVVGVVRQFDVGVPDAAPLAFAASGLGQALFAPPNVKGWPGGERWINASSLLARKQFLERMFRAEEMARPGAMRVVAGGGGAAGGVAAGRSDPRDRLGEATRAMHLDPDAWMTSLRPVGAASPEPLLLAVPRVEPAVANESPRAALRRLVLDPAYQVK